MNNILVVSIAENDGYENNLVSQGHVDKASTPEEAIEFLESGHYDFVISEFDLGEQAKRNGIRILLAAKKIDPKVVAVLIFDEDIRTEYVKKKIDYFFDKPVGMDQLQETVQLFIAGKTAG
jgi:DNA-binding NarL/FixJ family response regulator